MIHDGYIALFRENEALFQQNLPVWRKQMHNDAVVSLQNQNKATFADAYALDYGLNPQRLPFKGNPFSLFMCDIPGITTYNYLVLNDRFYAQPNLPALPAGVVICSLALAFVQHADLLQPYISQLALQNPDVALNQLLAKTVCFFMCPMVCN